MRKLILWAGVGAMALLAALYFYRLKCSIPLFEMPPQYSAEYIVTPPGRVGESPPTIRLRAYADGLKHRNESPFFSQDSVLVTINRSDRKMVYLLYPAKKQYMERSLQDLSRDKVHVAPASRGDPHARWSSLGAETVNGVKCKVVQCRTRSIEPHEEDITLTYYVDSNRNVPVRETWSDGQHASTTDYVRFDLGAPDPAFFEPPKDYQKVDRLPGFSAEQWK